MNHAIIFLVFHDSNKLKRTRCKFNTACGFRPALIKLNNKIG